MDDMIQSILQNYFAEGVEDVNIRSALEAAFKAGAESAQQQLKEEQVPALLKKTSDESKRMRELAGIPHKGNHV